MADMYCLLRLELDSPAHGAIHHPWRAMPALTCTATKIWRPASPSANTSIDRSARAGLIALRPLQVTSRRDTWHRQLLKQTRVRR